MEMASTPHTCIIGAGSLGPHLADELASRGWTNITVVEQGPLDFPGGSTWCSPNLVFQTDASKTLTEFAKYTVDKLRSVGCFDQVGGLEVATTTERLEELKHKQGWATSWGVEARIVGADECLDLHPLLNRESVLGGLYVPSDGIASAPRAAQLLIARTRELGVRYIGNTPVIGIERTDDRVTGVITPSSTIPADVVVSCAGFWGGDVARMVELPVPMLPLARQYVKTAPVPELAAHKQDDDRESLPILHFEDQNLYLRTHGEQIGIGYHGHRPMPVDASSLEIPKHMDEQHMPSRLPFTPEDFEPAWQTSRHLLPALQHTDISEGFNGVFSFTPEGLPLIGQAPLLDNFYLATGVMVSHSAGAARAIAELIIEGRSKVDITELDFTRFNEVQLAPGFVNAAAQRGFSQVYDIKHPLAPRVSPENLRVSPFWPREQDLGAHFEEWDAWEYPTYYESNAKLLDGMPAEWKQPEGEKGSPEYPSPIVAAEAWKTRTSVAMYDMTLLPRFDVSGPGALDLLQYMTTGDVSKKPGAITYALMLNNHGGIISDVTVARLEKNVFQVGGNTPIDVVMLQREARKQMQRNPAKWVQVRETTGGTCCIGLWGPKSRDVLHSVTTDDFSNKALRFFRTKRAIIGGIPVTVMRISYVGELGWEISTTADYGLRLWDTLWKAGEAHGVIAAGRVAFNSLRMEKGFKYSGFDITTEHNPYEAGLSFALKKGKKGYIGQDALEGVSQDTISRRICCLTVDDGHSLVRGSEPVYYNGAMVGWVYTE